MAQPLSPRIPTHGAVDLSALKARPAPPAARSQDGSALGVSAPQDGAAASGAGAHGPNPFVVEVNEDNFTAEVMATSMQVPVVLDFWAGWCQPCKQLGPILEALAAEYDGRFVLATIDTDANQRLSSEIGIQSLPTVMAVVAQQPVPLFTGALPQAQVREFLEELLRVAAENGISGRVAPRGGAPAPEGIAPEEEPIPHREAYEALVRGDLQTAEQGYGEALAAKPNDVEAAEGLARVQLLVRVQGTDPEAALKAADATPADVRAQCLAADVEVASGRPELAFARLVQLIRISAGDDRDAVREHLLGLFLVLGADDPRVGPARRALAGALF